MTGTIKASVAVEKVWVTQHSYTFRSEIVDVEPIVIMRRTCGSYGAGLRRFYYEALVKPPSQLSPEYGGLWDYGQEPHLTQLLRVSISRTLNPKWKPPVFTEGEHVIDLAKRDNHGTHEAEALGGKVLTRCAAGRDGECDHAQCPQQRDGALAFGRHCPLDNNVTED